MSSEFGCWRASRRDTIGGVTSVQKPLARSVNSKPTLTPPTIVRAETNFLRFPFFALSTKNIHKIDFREVTGTRKIKTEKGESTVDFTYRVSRNTDHVFPGQLSRKIHFALLSIMAKQGPDPINPIQFTWRQLAREMGVSYGGGKMIREMKQSIRSCLLYTSPSPRDLSTSRMPSSA